MGAQWKAKGKDLAANAKGRMFSKLAKDIMVAAALEEVAAFLSSIDDNDDVQNVYVGLLT